MTSVSLFSVRLAVNQSGTVVQKNHYYPFGLSFAEGLDREKQPYKYTGKELDKKQNMQLYDYSARYYDPTIGRFTTVDPLAEKYYSISPYAYCLNNPVKYIDPDGKKIVLLNVHKTDNFSGGYKAKKGVSSKTNEALKDIMQTKGGREFFAQFAKAGDIVGDYKFEKDGIFSEKVLTLQDFSFEKGYNSNLPLNTEGSISFKNKEVMLKVFSYQESKENIGEIVTHEIQLRGYKIKNFMIKKPITTEIQDHRALKTKDKKHEGYSKYYSTRKELELIDPAYKNSFEEAEEHAKRNY